MWLWFWSVGYCICSAVCWRRGLPAPGGLMVPRRPTAPTSESRQKPTGSAKLLRSRPVIIRTVWPDGLPTTEEEKTSENSVGARSRVGRPDSGSSGYVWLWTCPLRNQRCCSWHRVTFLWEFCLRVSTQETGWFGSAFTNQPVTIRRFTHDWPCEPHRCYHGVNSPTEL